MIIDPSTANDAMPNNDDQTDLLELLQASSPLTMKDLQVQLNMKRARVIRILSPLIDDNVVGYIGNGRDTQYYLI